MYDLSIIALLNYIAVYCIENWQWKFSAMLENAAIDYICTVPGN